jgi:glyoxylase-like metal-dependent hydrolase (beta-lactamase superfamily II)
MFKLIIFLIFSIGCTIHGFGQVTSTWFSFKEIERNVWVINDHKAMNIYLIIGKDSSLVVDTGIGSADLHALISKLTDKPLIVVNTHGSSENAGGNYQFDKVYVHPDDSLNARICNLPGNRLDAAKSILRGESPSNGDMFTVDEVHTKLVPVHEGHLFNLGERVIQVIETPGHTPGSICLLDIKNKFLFCGDNDNTIVWLFLKECLPLHDYLKTLEKLNNRSAEFNKLFPGHGIPKPAGFIKDQIFCVRSILNGNCEPVEFKSYAGDAMMCSFGQASVAYNPDNL